MGHQRGTSGNNATADIGGAEADEASDREEDLQASLERHANPKGFPKDMDPNDLFEGADDNYQPESAEDVSLGIEDYIVPEFPFEQECFRRRLVATARSM